MSASPQKRPGSGGLPSRAGLKDIAVRAGVSSATVSRVLNNRTDGFSVRPEVRARILDAARTLDYRPDLMAQSLRRAAMGIFGVVGLETPFDFPHHMIDGILEVLAPRGVQLSAHFAPSSGAGLAPPAWRVDGLFVIAAHSREDIAPIDAGGIPYVSINAWHGPGGGAVLMHDGQGTRLAMTHLLDLGHRRIAYAPTTGPWRNHPSVRARRDAYRSVLREHGLAPIDTLTPPTAFDATDFLREARRGGATAVLAYTHHIGMLVLKAAQAQSLCVPRDLSIVCFNDEYTCQLVHPPLTCVALPTVKAGRAAAEMLLEQVANPGLPRRVERLDLALSVRASTGPARRDGAQER